MKKFLKSFPLSLGKTAIFYPIIFVASLLFAQTVKMAVSYILFLFVLLLPLISLLHLTAARLCISATIRLSDNAVKKNSPLRVLVCVKNSSPLPFSLAHAALSLPDCQHGKDGSHEIIFSLIPFSHCRIERNMIFPLRGEYEIALRELRVYDMFRALSIKIPVKASEMVLVMPRILELPEDTAIKEGPLGSPAPKLGDSRMHGEPENIRTYEIGDSPKSIHWKLSSKSEDILVKELSGEERPTVNILCDMERHSLNSASGKYTEEDELSDLTCGDLVIEGAIAVCRRELELGKRAVISWPEDDEPAAITVTSESELMENMPKLCRIELSSLPDHPLMLSQNPHLPKGPTVFVASHIGEKEAKIYVAAADKDTEILFCRDKAEKAPSENGADEGLKTLSRAGIRVTEFTIS